MFIGLPGRWGRGNRCRQRWFRWGEFARRRHRRFRRRGLDPRGRRSSGRRGRGVPPPCAGSWMRPMGQGTAALSPRILIEGVPMTNCIPNQRFTAMTPSGIGTSAFWPASLCAEDAARFLGWPPYFLTLLARAGHLKPLGKPAQNSRKWYATVELERLGRDPDWLDKAIRIVERRVQTANLKTAGRVSVADHRHLANN